MSFLQIILLISSLVLIYMIANAWYYRKLRFFHSLLFVGWSTAIIILTFNPGLLTGLAQLTGVARGADFLVYTSIIALGFVFFSLLQHLLKQQQDMTRICTAHALREYGYDASKIIHSSLSSDYKASYCFLIRAYNESSVLWSVIDEIIHAWFSTIVICNDGSRDTTAQLIDQKIAEYPNARIIGLHHLINRWPGAANKTLFAFADRYGRLLGIEWFVTYDADGQMSISDMERFMTHADVSRRDVVIGSRFVKGGSSDNMPWLRRIILRWSRVVTYIFNGIWMTDVSTGYRMYHTDSIGRIDLISDRFGYQNDVIESIRTHRLRYTEIPVHIKYTDYSLAKGQSNMSALKILVRLVYQSLFYK